VPPAAPPPRPRTRQVRRARRNGLRLAIAGVALVALAGAVVGLKVLLTPASPPVAAGCEVRSGSLTYDLALDQAANATTITAVGKRLGLPDHAVTVALAAALQESQLHNLDYGDQDSLGLFQQRPSQGWGTPAQVTTPSYAAAAFFQHLASVPNWQNLPVTVAAQSVQRSAGPSAYAQWAAEARALAIAMTGEIPAGLRCQYPSLPTNTTAASLTDTISGELGGSALGVAVPAARGWTVATWLVGHATEFGILTVSFDGQSWSAATGTWSASGVTDPAVQITRAPSTR
jgi:hypothetical protein